MGRRSRKRQHHHRSLPKLNYKLQHIPDPFQRSKTDAKELNHMLYRRYHQMQYEQVKIERLKLDKETRRRLPILSASVPNLKTKRSRKKHNDHLHRSQSTKKHNNHLHCSQSTSIPLNANSSNSANTSIHNIQIYRPEINLTINLPKTRNERKQERRRKAKLHYANQQIQQKRDLWTTQIDKLKKKERRHNVKIQNAKAKAWLQIFALVNFHTQSKAIIQKRRMDAVAAKQLAMAANLIGNSLKNSYTRKKEVQHRRSSEILRERMWVARMNVRSRMRKQGASMIRDFIVAAVEAQRFTVVVKTYKFKVVNIQRKIKTFIVIHRTRLKLMMKMFRKYEGRVHRRLDRERKERERIEDEIREIDLAKSAKSARRGNGKVRSGNKKSGAIGKFIKQIDELGRNLDSVAFRLHAKTKGAREKATKRESKRGNKKRLIRMHPKVNKNAVKHVLVLHLRKKRKEHYDGMIQLRREAKERMEKVKNVNVEDMLLQIKGDKTLTGLYEEKMVNEQQRAVVYPVVKLFCTLKEDLIERLVVEAMVREAEMNRIAREEALKRF